MYVIRPYSSERVKLVKGSLNNLSKFALNGFTQHILINKKIVLFNKYMCTLEVLLFTTVLKIILKKDKN